MSTRASTASKAANVGGGPSDAQGNLSIRPQSRATASSGAAQQLDTRSSSITVHADEEMANANGGSSGLDDMQALGSSSRNLIQVIEKLSALNINSTIPSLPKFVVVGDQSAGKSSIIEAVCDISLPRSQGTCTKCPFQITTSAAGPNETWTCSISLNFDYKYSSSSVSKGKRSVDYDHWIVEEHGEQQAFAQTQNPNQLQDLLWRAQRAILSPNVPAHSFLQAPIDHLPKAQLPFSPNYISIRIRGPNLPELSIFDLPGAINVHEDTDKQHLPAFISKLIRNYIKDDKTRVLLAVALSHDIETSTAFRYVTACKAEHRTMGVLTKPDLTDAARYNQYLLPMLDGKKFEVKDGWFVTKQLSQTELDAGISHAEAKDRERGFFENKPWNDVLAPFADRFGVPELQDALSRKLTEHIVNELPEIIARVDSQLQLIEQELAHFPESAEKPCYVVLGEIDKVTDAILRDIRGDELRNDFREEYKKLQRTLRIDLKRLRPQVALSTPGHIVNLDSDMDDDSPMETPSKSRKMNNGGSVPISATATPTSARRPKPKSSGSMAPILAPVLAAPKPIAWDLGDIRKAYEQGSTSSIPGQMNTKVTESLILRAIRTWDRVVMSTVDEIKRLVQDMYSQRVGEIFEARGHTQLRRETDRVLRELVDGLMDKQYELIDTILCSELHKPVTYGAIQRDTVRAELQRKRAKTRVEEFSDNQQKVVKPEEITKKVADTTWMSTNLGNDPYTPEIDCLATILTYYDLAYARMHDTIANHLEFGLMNGLTSQLKEKLRAGLRATEDQHCAWLLAEDPDREKHRVGLMTEKAKLEAAKLELDTVKNQQY